MTLVLPPAMGNYSAYDRGLVVQVAASLADSLVSASAHAVVSHLLQACAEPLRSAGCAVPVADHGESRTSTAEAVEPALAGLQLGPQHAAASRPAGVQAETAVLPVCAALPLAAAILTTLADAPSRGDAVDEQTENGRLETALSQSVQLLAGAAAAVLTSASHGSIKHATIRLLLPAIVAASSAAGKNHTTEAVRVIWEACRFVPLRRPSFCTWQPAACLTK